MNVVSEQLEKQHDGRDEFVDPISEEREPVRDSTEIMIETLAALTQPTAAAASLVHLNWKSLLHTGSVQLHDDHENHSFYFDLPSVNTGAAALLVFAARQVDHWNDFITLNWNGALSYIAASYDQADNSPWFVTRIFRSASVDYSWQVHRIAPGKLKSENNSLRFHARKSDGTPFGNVDDFWISRIFLIYSMLV